MKIASVVGARPQFIKAAPVSKALRASGVKECLIHTGQHYDDNMSGQFFRELAIPAPDHNLEVGSGPHGRQTGQMLMKIEEVLLSEKPDRVVVYGDTNSTIAGALAAVKLGISLAHVEAGLRSFNRAMPEEHNRVLTDHCADLLFCPTQTAVQNLAREGILDNVLLVGDTMVDSILHYSFEAEGRSGILSQLGLRGQKYLLATIHRAENTDYPENLKSILEGLDSIGETIIFPVHPRTRKIIDELGWHPQTGTRSIVMVAPVGYLDMLVLEKNARMILTDSGGIQKEAYVLKVPCVTLREETEWIETVDTGWNRIAGSSSARIAAAARTPWSLASQQEDLFGDGHAAEKIVKALLSV